MHFFRLLVAVSLGSLITWAEPTRAIFYISGGGGVNDAFLDLETTLMNDGRSATDLGWYDNTGEHDPLNFNYVTGYVSFMDWNRFYRSFFVFRLPEETILSATLKLAMPAFGYQSPNPSETLRLWDITTDLTDLMNGDGGVAAFNDLGSGVEYGSITVFEGLDGKTLSIPLNATALAAMNAQRGNLFGIGGALDLARVRDPEPPGVPEPSSYAMAVAGLLVLAVWRIRRRVSAA